MNYTNMLEYTARIDKLIRRRTILSAIIIAALAVTIMSAIFSTSTGADNWASLSDLTFEPETIETRIEADNAEDAITYVASQDSIDYALSRATLTQQ